MNREITDPKPNRTKLALLHLHELRKEARVSVKELCRRIGKGTGFFDDLEDGKTQLTVEDFVDIVRALKFDPTEALDEIIHRRPWS